MCGNMTRDACQAFEQGPGLCYLSATWHLELLSRDSPTWDDGLNGESVGSLSKTRIPRSNVV